MKKFFIYILILLFGGIIAPAHVVAQTAINSPKTFVVTLSNVELDSRAKILHDYLASYNSPLADKADVFVKDADKYNLDWRLLPAIAGVESYFGTQLPGGSYNGWGFGIYNGNVRYFTSWDNGIDTVSKALREQYMNQYGAKNIYQVGSLYAQDPAWATKVQHFMDDISSFQADQKVNQLPLSI